MRTVGEILKSTRLTKHLTHDQIEKQLRIRKKFLQALEENDWKHLPSLTYIKGFIRNYSQYLGLSTGEMLAIFRRQYQEREFSQLLPDGVKQAKDKSIITFTPQRTIIGVSLLIVLILFTYLFFQLQSYINPPQLTVITPKEGEVIFSETVVVSGNTDLDAVLEINNEKIALNSDGAFTTNLDLNPGVNSITIKSTGKNGKVRSVTRTIEVQLGSK